MPAHQSLFEQLLVAFTAGKEHRIKIPTIMGHGGDLSKVASFRDDNFNRKKIILDFSDCKHLPLNAVAFLGGLISLIRHEGGNVYVQTNTISNSLKKKLISYGFIDYAEVGTNRQKSEFLPLVQYQNLDKNQILEYLEKNWIGLGAVKLSTNLQSHIMSNVWEIYANAFEHSKSPIGIINCVSFDRRKHVLQLVVMDFGLGIPANIRTYRPGLHIDTRQALKWAFSSGASTKAQEVGYGRGLGLHNLKQFIAVNRGSLEIISNDGYAKITAENEIYRKRNVSFEGTLVSINLSADEKFYCFAHEANQFRLDT